MVMTIYRVELTALLEATHVLEVEAESAEDAAQHAIEQAPMSAAQWEVLPSSKPKQIEVFSSLSGDEL
jgi:hypothetical protein